MVTIDEIIAKVKRYEPHVNERILKIAYEFAAKAHAGQSRKSGEEYITHPLETAKILTEFGANETVLIAALLHDVPEDTKMTLLEIKKKFGHEVAFFVDGITKLSAVHYHHDMERRQIESLRKLLLHSTKDARIILIKLADRLHNMRTLQFIPKQEKQLRIARETMEIYVPIAKLLGIAKIKEELENLCFQFLFSDKYAMIQEEIQKHSLERDNFIKKNLTLVQNALKRKHLPAKLQTSFKSLYTIYEKLENKGSKSLEIGDSLSFEIIVENKDQCYLALGIIHELFKPKPGRVKDYITIPKANGYQGLHTNVFGVNGIVTEFQIRTKLMQSIAEYGVAARFLYEKGTNNQKVKEWWVKHIIKLQKEIKDNRDFLENLKGDIFQDRIFNFTPHGKLIDLPKGSNCVDFAYAIHTELGNKAIKARIDGKDVPLATILGNGQTIKIISDETRKCPPREWLDIVITNFAKNKIKDCLKKESKEQKIKFGQNVLSKILMQAGKNFTDEFRGQRLKRLLEQLKINDLNSLLQKVGEGSLNSAHVLELLYSGQDYLEGKITQKQEEKLYNVTLKIRSADRVGILQEIIGKISNLHINILKIKSLTATPEKTKDAITTVYFAVRNFQELQKVFHSLEEVEGVHEIVRLMAKKRIIFFIASFFALLFWGLHPYLIIFLAQKNHELAEIFTYIGYISIFVMLYTLHFLTKKTFPDWKNRSLYWISGFFLIMLALFTVLAETFIFNINYHYQWGIIFAAAFLIYTYIIIDYFHNKYISKKK